MPRTIGILGGGQLARMTTLAACAAGLEVAIYDPDARCCAASVATRTVTGPWEDLERIRHFASTVEVVTLDREDVPVPALAIASVAADVFPSPEVMATIGNKLWQKQWLLKHGFPTAAFKSLSGAEAFASFNYPGYLKAQRGTFDGRGVIEVSSAADLESRAELDRWYFEEKIPFAYEVSVLVARSFKGEMVVYPPALNHHVGHILDSSVLGAPIDAGVVGEAQAIAAEIASQLGVVGLLVVEMFVTADGRVYVNEIAPRPHNSYHASERGCTISQFGQLVRVLAGYRLQSPELVRPTAIANLMGELWVHGEPDWERAMGVPGVQLHLYGKSGARPGRKMGHISAIGGTSAEALERAKQARLLATTVRNPSELNKGAYEHSIRCVTSA